jgi:hypothetical protein
MADIHEADIAEWIKGVVQKGSGNQWHSPGDVKNGEYLTHIPITGDGKSTMGKSISVSRDMWNKITEQTFGQTPALFLRFYQPGEQVRQIDLDLAVVRAGFFVDILEAARKWAEIEEEVGDDGVVGTDYVINLMRIGRDQQDKSFRELVQLGQDMAQHRFRPDGGVKSGCDCCR